MNKTLIKILNGRVIAPRLLVAEFPPRWPRFDPRPGSVGIVVNKVAQ
jgi:hypothetical protein